jgi:hypothetical protein
MTRPPLRSLVAGALFLVAPRLLAAQVLDVSRLSEEERERLRLARPAEVSAPAGRTPMPLDSLRPGMRLVVAARGVLARQEGVITALPARDTLLVDAVRSRLLVRVPVDRVTFMAVSTGRAPGGRAALGAFFGAAAGLATVVAADAIIRKGEPCAGRPGCGDFASFPALSGMFLGGGVGWVIGARRPGGPGAHIWRLVSVPSATGSGGR